jgi:glycosyltransferase involved in cell wall biosynthesis
MSPLPPGDTAAIGDTPAARPRPTLLTSGTGCDPIRGTNLGQAGYSYAFVARQFVRMLEADFDLRPGGALASGNPGADPPIAAHLGFRPPHEFELVPGVKNVLIPAWEFPEIPRAPWVTDPRQDWARTANACDLILQLCEFTREAFERGGVTVPMAVIPVPVAPEYFEVDDWRADREIVLETPALVLGGGGAGSGFDRPAVAQPAPAPAAASGSGRWGRSARTIYRRCVQPLVPVWLERGVKAGLREARRQRALTRHAPAQRVDRVSLSGVVFTTVFNPCDRRKNWEDLLSAWNSALGEREGVTLVLKLVGNDPSGLDEVLSRCQALDLRGGGRLILLTGFLTDAQMVDLARATTWYVTPTRAEGACLPLMQWLAAGRPAVATCHTAIRDYFSEAQGLVVESHPEPCPWPHDPAQIQRTTWQRTVWSSLVGQLKQAHQVALHDPARYAGLSQGARQVSRERHHPSVVGPRLRRTLWDLVNATNPSRPRGA